MTPEEVGKAELFADQQRKILAQSITVDQQIACVRRELAMRRNVYPKWVANGRMTQQAAEKEMAGMQAVHDTLSRMVEAPKP